MFFSVFTFHRIVLIHYTLYNYHLVFHMRSYFYCYVHISLEIVSVLCYYVVKLCS